MDTKSKIRDVAIIGSGPAALTAAMYLARDEFDVVVFEKGAIGGTVSSISHIENYPGFENGITGMELSNKLKSQAEKFGASIEYGEVTAIKKSTKGGYTLTVDGLPVKAKTILLATGCEHCKVQVPGEDEYSGRGVHYCATCDGPLYKDKEVVVIGGANSAVQEAIFLTKFAKHITIVALLDIMATKVLQNRLKQYENDGKITVLTNTKTLEIEGGDKFVRGVKVLSKDGKKSTIKADGVFVFIGVKPISSYLDGISVERDEKGYIKSNSKLQTSQPGIFIAGDLRSGSTKQAISAAGEGATAAVSISRYLELS